MKKQIIWKHDYLDYFYWQITLTLHNWFTTSSLKGCLNGGSVAGDGGGCDDDDDDDDVRYFSIGSLLVLLALTIVIFPSVFKN